MCPVQLIEPNLQIICHKSLKVAKLEQNLAAWHVGIKSVIELPIGERCFYSFQLLNSFGTWVKIHSPTFLCASQKKSTFFDYKLWDSFPQSILENVVDCAFRIELRTHLKNYNTSSYIFADPNKTELQTFITYFVLLYCAFISLVRGCILCCGVNLDQICSCCGADVLYIKVIAFPSWFCLLLK